MTTPKRLVVTIRAYEVELTSLDGWTVKLTTDDAQALVVNLVAAIRTLNSANREAVVH